MKPSLSSRATSRNPAVSSATVPASATYFALAGGRHAGDPTGENGGGSGIGGHHQVARRAERRERQKRQQ